MADFGSDLETFRAEARDWLEANFPASLRKDAGAAELAMMGGLRTECEDAGDHWVVNGQKIWTSGAQYADWCFCLVRTDPKAKKHEGISFVLIDMHQPGVETRPIKLIAGSSPFCETFFTDARVEKNDMVGPLNGGWTVGKRLLQHERSGQGGSRMMAGQDVVSLA